MKHVSNLPNLNLFTAEAGSGKTEQIVASALAALIENRAVVIIQPSTIQLHQTRDRLLEAINLCLPDEIADLSAKIRVLSSDGASHNEASSVTSYLNVYSQTPSPNLILLITHKMFVRYNFKADEWKEWDMHLDEALKIVDSTTINLTRTCGELSSILSLFTEEDHGDHADWARLTFDATRIAELSEMQENMTNDATLRKLSKIADGVVNCNATAYVKKGTMECLKDSLPLNVTESIAEIFKEERDTQTILNELTSLLNPTPELTTKLTEALDLTKNPVIEVNKVAAIRNKVMDALVESKTFDVFTVLNATVLTPFKEVSVYGANIKNTEFSRIWNLYKFTGPKVVDGSVAEILNSNMTKPKYQRSHIDINDHFNVIEKDVFTKHKKPITIFVPKTETMSKTKRMNNPHIDAAMTASIMEHTNDGTEAFVYLENNYVKTARSNGSLAKLKGAVDITHNMHGQNQNRHLHCAVINSSLNADALTSKFYKDIFNIHPNELSVLRHLDLFYQAILRTSMRVVEDKTPVYTWMLNNMMAQGLAIEYFDQCLILEVANTEVRTEDFITVEISKQCEAMRSKYPVLAGYTDTEIYSSKQYAMVDGKLKVTRTNKDIFLGFKENGDYTSAWGLDYRLAEMVEIANISRVELKDGDKQKGYMIRKMNKDMECVTTQEMIASGVFDKYSARGKLKLTTTSEPQRCKPIRDAIALAEHLKTVTGAK